MNVKEIEKIWLEVFPKSKIYGSKGCFTNDFYYRATLSAGKHEVYNGIIQNDPLDYIFYIEEEHYIEDRISFCIKPDNPIFAFGRVKLRRKTIKNVTPEKLKKRFLELKEKVVENKENFIQLEFDINEKI